MNDKKIFLRKGRTVLLAMVAVLAVGIGIGSGRPAVLGQASVKHAMAAGEGAEQTEAKKTSAQFHTMDAKAVFTESAVGSLWQVAAYKLGQGTKEDAMEEGYDEICTSALAENVLETLEQETLQLMASPVGATFGGRIKVYAGDTPLLITEEDKEVLLRIVEAEATGEDVKGRMLVANVILNRVVSEEFPDSIAEVVFENNGQTYQFAPIKDGRYWRVRITDKTREAVERVLAGEDYSRGALYFAARRMANQKAMRWFDTSLDYLFSYGVHEFFTEK